MARDFKQVASSSLGFESAAFVYRIIAISNSSHGTFAAISSDDSLALFTITLDSITVQQRLEAVHGGVACLDRFPGEVGRQDGLVTAGRDGHVKLWSRSSSNSKATILAKEFRTPKAEGISALACLAERSLIAVGTELESQGPGDVAVYIWDVKGSSNLPIRQYVESHTDTMTRLSFQLPSTTTAFPLLLCSSTDGLVNVFDLAIADEDDAVISVVNNKSAVQHFCLMPNNLALNSVCVVSADEQLAVYSLADESISDADVKPWDLREKLNCDYAISLSLRDAGVILAVGANKAETSGTPYVDLLMCDRGSKTVSDGGPVFSPAIRLHGGHGEEVVRDIWFAEDSQFVITCGEDGLVRVWRDAVGTTEEASIWASQPATAVEDMEGIEGGSKKERRKKRKSGQDDKKRFKPY